MNKKVALRELYESCTVPKAKKEDFALDKNQVRWKGWMADDFSAAEKALRPGSLFLKKFEGVYWCDELPAIFVLIGKSESKVRGDIVIERPDYESLDSLTN